MSPSKRFSLAAGPNFFPCQDIWEEQLEKTIAYTQALQYWVEKSNPSMPGQSCLLARCILKLRETIEWYISFSDDTILDGVAPPEGFLGDQTKITVPRDAQLAFTDVPTEEVTVEEAAPIGVPLEEPTMPQAPHEEQMKVGASPNQFPSWRKVLHPSQPVTTTGQAPLSLSELRQRHHNWSFGERRAQCWRAEEHLQVELAEWDSTSPPGSPKSMQEFALPLDFKEVTAYLQRDPSSVTAFEAPLEPTQPEVMIEPVVATMCTSCIVQDKASRITYMDTVTTFRGWVALGSSCPVAQTLRLTIEDITDLS